jgi:hypothetical protein
VRAIVVTTPEDVKEQEVPDYLDHLVIPLPTPMRFEPADAPLPTIADAYPTVLLARHTIRHDDPRIGERVAFWPTSWADYWGMDAIKRAGMLP